MKIIINEKSSDWPDSDGKGPYQDRGRLEKSWLRLKNIWDCSGQALNLNVQMKSIKEQPGVMKLGYQEMLFTLILGKIPNF